MSGIVGLPALRVEAALGYGPSDIRTGAAVWTDVTAAVRVSDGLSWSRGRQSERDTVTAGTAQGTINTDRWRDLYGDLPDLRTPLRVRWYGPGLAYDSAYTYNEASLVYDDTTPGTPVTLWTGTLDDWGGSWTGGIRPVTAVNATDLVSRASLRTLDTLPVERLKSLLPYWLYILDEDSTATTLEGVGWASATAPMSSLPRLTTSQVGTGGTATWGSGYAPGALTNGAEATVASFTPGASAANYVMLQSTGMPAPSASTFWTSAGVSVMVLPGAFTYAATVVSAESSGGGTYVRVGITTGGKATATVKHAGGTFTTTGTTTLPLTSWTQITVRWQDGVGLYLRLNGAAESSTTYTAPTDPDDLTTLKLGVGGYNGNIAHACVLSYAGAAGDAGAASGWSGDTTTARASRIAGYVGWPATVGTGVSTMSAQATKGATLADALQSCADTEVAPWWLDANGTIRMEGRTGRYLPVTADFTIPAYALEQSTQFQRSDVGLINHVTATDALGNKSTKVNTESVARYDPYPFDITVYAPTATDLDYIAEGLANWTATPQVRSDSITVDLVTAAASITNFTAAVTADIGDVLQVTDLPDDYTGGTAVFFVEGVQDSVNQQGWKRTFNVSPAGNAAWTLEDAVYGALGTTTRLGF